MNIKQLRKQHGLSQAQLAKLAGITQSTIVTWEKGSANPSLNAIRKLLLIFNCTADDLINPPPNKTIIPKREE
ncbi:MAG: helix-turn-helix domain-containing protein [Turicibacter sp.]|nr:helix-turn-helix domain-containing protein [Turicibacter sp.]